MNKGLGEKINKLRELGYSYDKIVDILKCSKGTVAYHLGINQKIKTRTRSKKYIKSHPYLSKIDTFSRLFKIKNKKEQTLKLTKRLYLKIYRFLNRNKRQMQKFNLKDVVQKFGENPKCYLTGQDIDITKTRSYEFDHIIPSSRGGDNSLDNLGICTQQVNQSKNNMTPDEYINLCKKVLEYNGYKITKKE